MISIDLTPSQLRAIDYSKHIALTANAGSGKTTVLTQRFLNILIEEKIPLKKIVAITFTEKAAGELYNKITELINTQIKETSDIKLKSELEKIRSELVSANISTIHSFCINLLREFPVEANLDVNFIPIDTTLSNELTELSIEEVINQAFNDVNLQNDIKYLVRIFGSIKILSNKLEELIDNKKIILQLKEELYTKNENEIADFYNKKSVEYLKLFFDSKIERTIFLLKQINDAALKNNSEYAIKADEIINKLDTENIIKFIQQINSIKKIIFTSNGNQLRTQKYLKKNVLSEELKSELQELLISFSDFNVEDDYENIHLELAKFSKIIIKFFDLVYDKYEDKKKNNSYLDFEDILLFTRNILKNKKVRKEISDKYKYIMIDEYQDTNEIQYQIFFPILEDLKKGNLFVIGDEKQSIYMFRDAELEVFRKTKDNISAISGDESILVLPESFRMSPKICAFTNEIFENLFKNPNPVFNEVEFNETICANVQKENSEIEILLNETTSDTSEQLNYDDNDDYDDEQNPSEAKLVINKINQLVNIENKLNWKDITILCRKRKFFEELEEQLIEKNIPYSIVGGKGFYQRQFVYDIYNYFSFLLNQQNDTALIGILRSPFFMLSDQIIFEISLQEEKTSWEKLKSFSNDDNYKNIVEQLNENIKLSNSIDVISLLRKITTETPFLSVLSARKNGKQELANFEKLVSHSMNFVNQGFRNLYDYVNFLKDSIQKSDDVGQAAIAEQIDSVKLMTIHQMKGLQNKAIFIYSCNSSGKNNNLKSNEIYIDKEFGILSSLPFKYNFFEKPKSGLILQIHNFIKKKKLLAELKRLFYVAITRSENFLFLSASFKKNKNGNISIKNDSFFKLFFDGLPQFNIEASDISIKRNLKYYDKNSKQYFDDVISFTIPITKKMNDEFKNDATKNKNDSENITDEKKSLNTNLLQLENIYTKEIISKTSEEIISATKISIYNQCPLKYKLTYEIGFSPLYKNYKDWLRKKFKNSFTNYYDFKDKEIIKNIDEEIVTVNNYSARKGSIIHKVLENNITENNLDIVIDNLFQNEFDIFEKSSIQLDELKKDIIDDLKKFYSSEIYKEIISYENYKNEFEIYSKEKDYYLYGIIDKLIINNDKIIIVDYKTDEINENNLSTKLRHYLTQLMFYAYLTSKLFQQKTIEIKLIFIKEPEKSISQVIERNSILDFKQKINEIVNNIRLNNFPPDTNHCSECHFADENNRCVFPLL